MTDEALPSTGDEDPSPPDAYGPARVEETFRRLRRQVKAALIVAMAALVIGPAVGAVTASTLAKTGPPGPAGISGAIGPAGPAGARGLTGITGLRGRDGTTVDPGTIQQQILLMTPLLVDRICLRTNAVTSVFFIPDNGFGSPTASVRTATVCGLP